MPTKSKRKKTKQSKDGSPIRFTSRVEETGAPNLPYVAILHFLYEKEDTYWEGTAKKLVSSKKEAKEFLVFRREEARQMFEALFKA